MYKITNDKFPIEIYDSSISKDDLGLEMHWQNDLVIIYHKDNESEYIINGYTYIAKKGSFIIINPKQVHQEKSLSDKNIVTLVLSVNYNLLLSKLFDQADEKYILELSKGKLLLPSILPIEDPLYYDFKDLFNRIIKEIESNKFGKELKVKSLLFEIVYLFLSNKRFYSNDDFRRKKELEDNHFVRETIQYIHDTYQDQVSLDMISENVNVSKFHLCREFKEETGQTVNNYLINYRLSMAKKLLTETKKDVTEIAFEVGFNNPSYFIAKFKDVYLVTPNVYRNQKKSDSI